MMTPDELFEEIQLAGFEFHKGDAFTKEKPHHESHDKTIICTDELMKFAELIQERTKENCAKFCELLVDGEKFADLIRRVDLS